MDVNTEKVTIDDQKISVNNEDSIVSDNDDCEENKCDILNSNDCKRKNTEDTHAEESVVKKSRKILDCKRKNTKYPHEEEPVVKKSRKILEIERAVDLLSKTKADSCCHSYNESHVFRRDAKRVQDHNKHGMDKK